MQEVRVGEERETVPLSGPESGTAEIEKLAAVPGAPKSQPSEGTARREPERGGLGLTEAQLAALSELAATSVRRTSDLPEMPTEPRIVAGKDDGELLDFALPEEKHVVTSPPPKQVQYEEQTTLRRRTPEDEAFVPASLDDMDDIWDLPDIPLDEGPARITIERTERSYEQDTSEQKPIGVPEPASGGLRPEPSGAQVVVRDRRTRPAWRSKSSGTSESSSPIGIPTGDAELDEALRTLEAEPQNYGLCLAIAHIGAETARYDLAIHHYQRLIKAGELLDEVLSDLLTYVRTVEEPTRQRFYRLIGDCYTKQKRFKEALAAYRGKLL